MERKKTDYIIQSVSHALDILEEFCVSEESEMGVTELSKKLGLHKNNVFRLLATLESRGYIEQNPVNGNYQLGYRSLELGQVFVSQLGLLKQARPVLEEAVAKCNESIYLGVLRDTNVVYLDIVETSHPVRVVPRVGTIVPAYCTAIGKAQLSHDSSEEVERILSQCDLRKWTPNTLDSVDKIMEDVQLSAKRGYAVDLEEYQQGVVCVGVSVKDYTNTPVAGISFTGPVQRMTLERVENEILPIVMEAGREISRRLGAY
ncbi:IclR family transcriptional regulator [Desulfurispirillum indicum]|uniref:Transcriptional regulator IclR n=1 Tax=Desulfurispirillum indicum (strain ATCC BAA-1389 / DSM 22839 / S5) TaxID=653733 RepID=E6W2A1_DESIS|nr:IclR family transcriptional regulator [Desulfurispirillum indicum]ADU65559.1 Transcriptional regulator IclR [Desulfurispirillum indicum S5]UCZ57609.1 IclR family transcriptional regulator [Desulfurispirillum indicum]